MNLQGLRKIASMRKIKGYFKMNTSDLVGIITNITEEEMAEAEKAIEKYRSLDKKRKRKVHKSKDVQILKEKLAELNEVEEDQDLVLENIKLRKQLQKQLDTNRVLRKETREDNRELNVLEELTNETIALLREQGNSIEVKIHETVYEDLEKPKGVAQFSDLHGNEKIDILGNQFDFKILSKRVRYKVLKDIKLFKSEGIKDIVLAFTGDLLNSDRRLDEILTNKKNRAAAIFNLKDILLNAILEYNKHFNVSIASVIGNESRIDEDIHFEEQIASNNFDYMVFRMLAEVLHKKVSFAENSSSLETVIDVNGNNILLLHGHSLNKNIESSIPKLKTKYSDQGVIIRYIISGHIHSTLGSSQYSRSASMAGGNAYSFFGLNLSSRAQQNSYIVHKNGNIDVHVQDLQEIPSDIIPYVYSKNLDCYTEKSLEKYKKVNGIKIYKV